MISPPIFGIAVEFTAAMLFGLLVIAFAPLFGPVTLVVLGAASRAAARTSVYFYAHHRLLIDFTYPLLSTTAIYLTLIFSSFVRERSSAADPFRLRHNFCRQRWLSSSRSRRKSWCSAARSAR